MEYVFAYKTLKASEATACNTKLRRYKVLYSRSTKRCLRRLMPVMYMRLRIPNRRPDVSGHVIRGHKRCMRCSRNQWVQHSLQRGVER